MADERQSVLLRLFYIKKSALLDRAPEASEQSILARLLLRRPSWLQILLFKLIFPFGSKGFLEMLAMEVSPCFEDVETFLQI